MHHPLIIGLIGGVASGKSTVAKLLAAHGALWLDSDRMAHEVLNWPETQAELHAEFGDRIFAADHTVDRRQLANLVFGDDEPSRTRRAHLEQMVHPRVRQLTEARILAEGSNYPAIVIDAPLLLEAGWGNRCDHILLIDTPLEKRMELAATRNWSLAELQRREASQMSIELKRQQATDIIVNCGSLEELAAQVAKFWQFTNALPSD